MTVESLKQDEAHGEFCAHSDLGLVRRRCAGAQGCITGFEHLDEFTEFSGPLDRSVRSIRVTVGGRAASGDINVTHVPAELARRIQASAPFGFFAVFLPGCVPSDRVRVALFGVGGSPLGKARGWTPPLRCTKL